jgi:hypothetical protein
MFLAFIPGGVGEEGGSDTKPREARRFFFTFCKCIQAASANDSSRPVGRLRSKFIKHCFLGCGMGGWVGQRGHTLHTPMNQVMMTEYFCRMKAGEGVGGSSMLRIPHSYNYSNNYSHNNRLMFIAGGWVGGLKAFLAIWNFLIKIRQPRNPLGVRGGPRDSQEVLGHARRI